MPCVANLMDILKLNSIEFSYFKLIFIAVANYYNIKLTIICRPVNALNSALNRNISLQFEPDFRYLSSDHFHS